MSTTMTLQQAVVDADFRSAVLADPAAFGLSAATLPPAVEQQDADAFEAITEGIVASEVYACESTCSFGPFTFVCDGTSK
ncbi:cinnamycin family lantibiotic [Nocardiopsis trehalosi]|jgi:aminoglycoside/choline kinase family phosphotransferase|uniref:cinnamycin family lantibiotic n=1 Tax=Nocardiopsis trehalosi TaxID=109329 RepID=UPI00082AE02F|nr:cinnamycin family lantibiotic [Nocardiopsis trehalosi]